ncbi:aminoglycoside phosphotransferase family protein [Phycicoccus flavus]|uniref:Streptomycin 6-kinase n=1 Tax=Phycicoccus flavus TaxID=2502783 RepID=A0A8T6R0G6_9MICO|nr:aminoglycoside phosphotransferase family protein [Phycicoccus flavus]NHA67034.1 hypothetical protein [Phycicoccus flavus]
MSDVALPAAWVQDLAQRPAEGGPSGAEWLREVPRLLEEALQRWDLVVDGPARTGATAVVVPVRRGEEALALKVVWPHPEATHEALALRTWGGVGAVRLVAALPSRGVLLLERLDADTDLVEVWTDEACEVVGGLLARLHVAAPPRVPGLAEHLAPHLERMARRAAVPRRVVERTHGLARDLLPDDPGLLLHTDLHYANVLRGRDGEWLAIDPKPVAGHPGFEVWPLLGNRVDELGTGAALRWSVRHRLGLVADAAGVDVEEARAWTLLRAGVQVSWATTEGPEALTTCVALHKALDD